MNMKRILVALTVVLFALAAFSSCASSSACPAYGRIASNTTVESPIDIAMK